MGLTSPIMAIFIKDSLIGGTIAAAGIASAIFLLVKSFFQIIISKRFNPQDRLWLLIVGTFFMSIVPFIWAFSTHIWHIYLAQAFFGIASAMASPAFSALFILNISRKKPGYEWSIYSTSVSIGTGIAAYSGAVLASIIGFQYVFFLTGLMALIGALILIKLTSEKIKQK